MGRGSVHTASQSACLYFESDIMFLMPLTNQAMNICILARYGNGGAIQFNPTTKCAGSTVRGPADVPHWFGNCQKDDMQESSCCSNAALLDSRFEWTHFAKGNSCQGDDDFGMSLCFFLMRVEYGRVI